MLAPDTHLKDRYKIIRQLARGGMGTVYEAHDLNLDCKVAIKENLADTEELRYAFIREAKLLAQLNHSVFPRVLEHFTLKSGQFLVMQFISGENLAHELDVKRSGAPFPTGTVLGWAEALLNALDYLHTLNPKEPIVHRDIKPANLKLTERGQPILLDFGLARGSAGLMSTMKDRSTIGYTPGYGPPEQSLRHSFWTGHFERTHPKQLEQVLNHGTDPRSDIFALGATLYHLLTGTIPPDAPTRIFPCWSNLPDPLRPASELNPQVSPALSELLQRALALEPSERFASAAEMLGALRALSWPVEPDGGSGVGVVVVSTEEETASPSPISSPVTLVHVFKYGIIGRCDDAVRSISYSPDGRYVASGSNDNAVRVWNIQSGEMRVLGRCGAAGTGFAYVSAVHFAPDSSTVASASNDKTLRLWSVKEDGMRILGKYRHPLRSISFAHDGGSIVSGSSDGTVLLWDVETGEVEIVGKCDGVVWAVSFSPDDRHIVSESDDKTLRIWDVRTKEVQTFKSEDDDVRSLAYSPDGKNIAAATWDHRIRLWEVLTHRMRVLGECDGAVRSVSYSPDGEHLASGSDDKIVRMWNVLTGRCRILGLCDDVVSSVVFSPDGKTVASGSWDNTVRLWDAR
jgi:WD40 repeat protein/tRNA A-37 threonylcarbamoyl transferase component Bud32